eukprot:CAMPEP_0185822494 /NCGR_PEP_ID=MMETSP1322-20130828/26824_1 /TAXON_ID=265543 /ORGANISM="Minutocellus polymorphus, Strain RCC2270" /LENGTH=137 /DNA_ID=CAMNT_0028519967 /DNA_START=204 /DNA_END=617 /DNA_ORIENTATION=+
MTGHLLEHMRTCAPFSTDPNKSEGPRPDVPAEEMDLYFSHCAKHWQQKIIEHPHIPTDRKKCIDDAAHLLWAWHVCSDTAIHAVISAAVLALPSTSISEDSPRLHDYDTAHGLPCDGEEKLRLYISARYLFKAKLGN